MTAFAMITADSDCLLNQVSRCAATLYNWLLRKRPAGTTFEVDLDTFRHWTGKFRKKPYCFKWIRQAVTELADIGLVDIQRQYNSKIYKLAAYRPGNKTSQIENKTSQFGNKTSQKRASNPDAAVPSYIDTKDSTDQACSAVQLKFSFLNSQATDVLEQKTQSSQGKNVKNHEAGNAVTGETHKLDQEKEKAAGQSVESTRNIDGDDGGLISGEQVINPQEVAETMTGKKTGAVGFARELRQKEKEKDKRPPVQEAGNVTTQAIEEKQSQTEEADVVVNSQAKTHLERLDDLGIVLNPALVRLVKTTAAEIIEGAISTYQRYRRDHYVKNPAGFFVYAVKNAVANNHTSERANFFYWFEAMKKLGRLGYYEEVDGDYLVRDGIHLVSWQVLVKRGWTCDYLQKRLRR
ncbi:MULTISPECIES: hypothetical protein [Cyanophyceae]|uniref:hypothetical protein n=1 Tax=Cyanophyceae TaxID=3028117 RepID=UPI00016DCEF9|nr:MULTISPECIES: hypothetical protein [Cyanophyceae]ACB01004.1 hypothetical protein SYNPCC7002_F0073 [Picosynechococcus sp. PCC 7002]SMH58386.1 hypothetical protein SAMN06272755_3161 [Picosynechococcus sp. OG1]SMQ86409.1 hypothetical protein SAMN06272774_3152 [Synechococcus sp. 7002]